MFSRKESSVPASSFRKTQPSARARRIVEASAVSTDSAAAKTLTLKMSARTIIIMTDFFISVSSLKIWLSVFCFGFLLALKYNTSGITELSHKVLTAHPVSVYNTGRKLKRSFSCFLKVKIQEKSRQGVDPAGLNKVRSFKIRRARYCQHIRGWRGRLRRCRTLRHS